MPLGGVVSVKEECVLLCGDLLQPLRAFPCPLWVGAVGPEVALEMLGGVDRVAGDQDAP